MSTFTKEQLIQSCPSALLVPETLDYQGAKELYNYLMTEEETNATVNGWNACRATMLLSFGNSEQLNSPVIPDGWVACSERMPESDGNYWGWWSESKRQGPVWFIKSELQAQFQSSEITHWMPLPAAPQQEVK